MTSQCGPPLEEHKIGRYHCQTQQQIRDGKRQSELGVRGHLSFEKIQKPGQLLAERPTGTMGLR